MYEGKQKHAIRGENRIQSGVDEHGKAVFYGGEYQADKAFSNAPAVFLDFAKKMWEAKFWVFILFQKKEKIPPKLLKKIYFYSENF